LWRKGAHVFLKNSLISLSSDSLTTGSYKKKVGLTPKELAMELQEMRKEIDNHTVDLRRLGNIQSKSEMITQLPLFRKDETASNYLHTRPEMNTPHRTCILENGSRFFLKCRANFLGNRGSENTVEKYDTRMSGNLLSKSMSDLLKEADNLKIKSLANKERLKSETRDQGTFGDDSAACSLHEKGLWVDKYAPKVFSQLLSPEKTNREVLRALKLWDDYVFRGKKSVPSHDTFNFKKSDKNTGDNISSPKSVKKRKVSDEEEKQDNDENAPDGRNVRTWLHLRLT
jgi:hypothetical protein